MRAGILGANGKPWSTTTLRSTLLRCSNAGLRKHQGQIVGQGTWEALIDRDTYDRVVAILSDPTRRTSPASSGIKYLLSGIARCGLCGGPMRVLVVGKDGRTPRARPRSVGDDAVASPPETVAPPATGPWASGSSSADPATRKPRA